MISKIERGTGLTPSEERLAKLADHTFLDLWSWPNVYKSPGKELCDLLVVCGDDVIIFSDKSIEWPSGDMEIAWARWYRRAIGKSVDQIRGAARWLQNSPTEIYADAKCSQHVPLKLPPPERRRVHGICVALGAEHAASTYFKGSDGTFMIFPHLKGDSHVNFREIGHEPFAIGDVDPGGPFVHVFNQSALSIVMHELDTIKDFTAYLTAREILIRTERLAASPSEMEILANYFQCKQKGADAFPVPEKLGLPADYGLFFVEGEYAALLKSPIYKNWMQIKHVSFAWDKLIRLFTEGVLKGRQYRILDIDPTVELAEQALRIMAREDRLRRVMLSHSFMGAMQEQKRQKVSRLARVVMPDGDSENHGLAYVFVVFSNKKQQIGEIYRKIRAAVLHTYCMALLHDHRELTCCVGIALNALSDKGSSEDLIAIEQIDWTKETEDALREDRKNYEILLDPRALNHGRLFMSELLPDPEPFGMSRQHRRAMKHGMRAKHRR